MTIAITLALLTAITALLVSLATLCIVLAVINDGGGAVSEAPMPTPRRRPGEARRSAPEGGEG